MVTCYASLARMGHRTCSTILHGSHETGYLDVRLHGRCRTPGLQSYQHEVHMPRQQDCRRTLATCAMLCMLLILFLSSTSRGFAGSDPQSAVEATVEQFLTFATEEWEGILASIEIGHEHATEIMGATKIPMSSKQIYAVLWIKEKPTSFRADVMQTQSLRHPLKGTIAFTVQVERGVLIVRGPKKYCRGAPLAECLAGGGKIVKGGFLTPGGGQRTAVYATEVVLRYLPSGDTWVREDERTVLEIVGTVASASVID